MVAKSDDILNVFGNALRDVRKERDLSQEELALRCGLDRTYISGLERGRRNPTLKVMLTLATHLDMTLSELLSSIKKQEISNDKDK
jgi:transcriptional regulator with XRE-family HTH domain